MRTYLQDVRYSCRLLLQRPGFTAVLVLTLGIGIGATTAIFGVVHAALLRPLPYSDPDRLMVSQSWRGPNQLGVSWLDYADWKERTKSFEELVCYFESEVHVAFKDGGGEKLGASTATRNLFGALRVEPLLGRVFLPQEAMPGAAPVAILSHDLWSKHFGSDPKILGRQVLVEGGSHVVVGVMPPGFKFPSKSDLWTPLEPLEGGNPRSLRGLNVFGRLKPDGSLKQAREQAKADMDRLAGQLAAEYPESNEGVRMSLIPLSEFWVKDLRPSVLLLLGACCFLLLIACSNVANLLLARATSRQREMSVRTALGASRSRIVRQLLTESVVLSLFGGLAGLLIASWGTQVLARVIADSRSLQVPYWVDLGLDGTVLAFAVGVSVLVGLLFGLAPALPAVRVNLLENLKEGTRGSTGGKSGRLRHLFAVAEVALALTLLVGAGLLGKSLVQLWQVDPGFSPDRLLTLKVRLPFYDATDRPGRAALFQEVHRRLEALPGVVAAGANSSLPLTGEEVWTRLDFAAEGQSQEQIDLNPQTNLQRISPSYFQAMKIPLLQGRFFDNRTTVPGAPKEVIVNKGLAELLWPGQNPLGRRLNLGKRTLAAEEKAWSTVVGVVGDVKHRAVSSDTDLDVYVSFFQSPSFDALTLVMRTRGEPTGIAAAARSAVSSVSPELLVEDVQTMEQIVDKSLWHARLWGLLFGTFSVVALLLAAVGIYGVMSYNVSQRTREIGLRAALGADPRAVARLILGQGLKMAGVGIALGLLGALTLSRFLSSLLYQVNALDPATYLVNALALGLIAAVATWIPMNRALRIDPVIALKNE